MPCLFNLLTLLAWVDGTNILQVLDELMCFFQVQRVSKPHYDFNVLEVSTPVSAAELRSLARGRLLLTVEAVGTPERRIVGSVRQKAACEVYNAPLVSERLPATPAPEGLALLYIDKEGSLVYDIQVQQFINNNKKECLYLLEIRYLVTI